MCCILTNSVSIAPWEGVNALDAAVLAYNNISAMRQQVHPESRIHGIILGSQEWVCNIIPAHSGLQCKQHDIRCQNTSNLTILVLLQLEFGIQTRLKWPS